MQSVHIYGAGMLAKHMIELCNKVGIKVASVIDPKKVDSTLAGFRVVDTSEIKVGSTVFIAVLNNFVSMAKVSSSLYQSGAGTVLTPPEAFFYFGENGISSDWYWLSTHKGYVHELATKSRSLLNPILDDFSNSTLDMILNYRCSGLINESFIQSLDQQYFVTGIEEFWSGNVNLLDGGAYDGDTIISARLHGVNLTSVVALEPDPSNYFKLRANTVDLGFDVTTFQAGLSDENSLATFNFTASTGSAQIESSDLPKTQLIAFDSIAPRHHITHIKLDIEGMEAKALLGMKKTIETLNPNMAISVYHKPEDIFELSETVMKLGNYNKFSLRNYAHQSFETIFYACAR